MVEKRKNLKTIKISEKLHAFLSKKGNKGETYEDIIWRLVKEGDGKKKNYM